MKTIGEHKKKMVKTRCKTRTCLVGVYKLILCLAVLMLIVGNANAGNNGELENGIVWELNDGGVLSLSGVGSISMMPDLSKDQITKVVIGNGIRNIPDFAFSDCRYLEEVIIPKSVTSIGSSAFRNCSLLSKIEIPANVTYIGDNAFRDCSSISGTVVLPSGLTGISVFTFSGCESIERISIPSSVKSIGDYAFSECKSLVTVNIPAGVTNIGKGLFSDCICLKDIVLPNGITEIGSFAFWDCDSITAIRIPSSVKSIGEYAFFWCDGLSSIEIPEGVLIVDELAFGSCENLSLISLPSSLKYIGEDAFNGPDGLNSATVICKRNTFSSEWALSNDFSVFLLQGSSDFCIPSSTRCISEKAFQGIDASIIKIQGNNITIEDYAFANLQNDAVVYMPEKISFVSDSAFLGSNVIFVCGYESESHVWALSHDIECILK